MCSIFNWTLLSGAEALDGGEKCEKAMIGYIYRHST